MSPLRFTFCATWLILAGAVPAGAQSGYRTVAGLPSIPDFPLGALLSDDAGSLWGVSSYNATGGAAGSSGTVFRVDPTSGSVRVMAQLPDRNENFVSPEPGLTDDGQGFFWGMTSTGGLQYDGTIFKVEVSTGRLAIVATFDNASINGANPLGRLVNDGQGFLWGITSGGGRYGGGTAFKIETATGLLTTVHEFMGGEQPQGGLASDGAGALWGAANGNPQTLYKIDIATGAYKVMTTFDDAVAQGQEPNGSLLNDGAGHFWGSTATGGSAHRGNIYQVEIATGHVAVKAELDGIIVSGTRPGPLALDAQGQVWGVTRDGGPADSGTVFRLDTTGLLSTVFTFDDSTNLGTRPAPQLYADAAGRLEGATTSGALAGRGSIFQIDPAAATLVTLAQFRWELPSRLLGPLTPDGHGQLWGSAPVGGGSEAGCIYHVSEQTGQVTVAQALTGQSGAAKGTQPQPLLQTPDGNFWGVTTKGGANDLGTIFRLSPATGDFSTMIEFTGKTGVSLGSAPTGLLAADGQGNLWGTTQKGGAGDFGTVFKYNLAGGTLSTVVEFTGTGGGARGSGPSTLQSDGLGNLWGTTFSGGAGDFGTIFKIHLQTSAFSSTHAFTVPSGPYDGVVSDGHGFLWGTNSAGLIYKFSPATGKPGTVVVLGAHNGGSAPHCRLASDGVGYLWGTSEFSSHTSAPGVLYKVRIANGAFTHLLEFSESGGVSPGAFPAGGLVRESDGTLYGVTSGGGVLRATGQPAGGGQIFAVGPKVLPLPTPVLATQAGSHFVVSATINPGGSDTTAYFRYSPDQDFSAQTVPQALGSGHQPVALAADLTGLQPGTRYFVQLVTETAGGPAYSAPVAFFTLASTLELVAAQGDSVPGGYTLKTAGPPAIDGTGQVAFRATLAGPGLNAATNASLLLASGGVLTEVAQTRSASNAASSAFTQLSDPVLGSGGALSFIGTLKLGSVAGGGPVTASNNQAIFIYEAGAATLALRKGQPIESGGPSYLGFLSAGLNHAGGLVVLATVSDPRQSPAFLASDLSGQLHWLARKGSSFAGFTVAGSTELAPPPFAGGQARSVEMESGNVALLLQGAGRSQAIGVAIPAAHDFTLGIAAQTGSGYASLDEPAIDAQGDLTFCGSYSGSAKTARFFHAGLTTFGNSFSEDLRVGTPYDYPFSGLSFKALGDPQISDYGQYAFVASWKDTLYPAGDQVLLYKSTSYGERSYSLLAQAGDYAADGQGGLFQSFQQIAVPATGRPLFAATLSGVPPARNQGVWALCTEGLAAAPVVLKGLGLEVRGATKIVSRIALFAPASGAMGQNRGLEPASRRFAFQVTFTDGTWAIYQGRLPDFPIANLPP